MFIHLCSATIIVFVIKAAKRLRSVYKKRATQRRITVNSLLKIHTTKLLADLFCIKDAYLSRYSFQVEKSFTEESSINLVNRLDGQSKVQKNA